MKTFEEIAEDQGWDSDSIAQILRDYITNQQDDAALAEYAERVAAEENGE